MSNIYIKEPATHGKVLLLTSAGDIEVELWPKEAPLACRNFVQLCLEGYYRGCVFHRVIPKFIAQGGDPTGTGEGGESVYGKPFKDEFHSRLRFVRRGLVAMANAGRDDNGSQFFFTLGPAKELDNKHTIFGQVAGDTVYNLPRFEEGEIGKDDRPIYPHKITGAEVLLNPFDDIVPRETITNEVAAEATKKTKKGVRNLSLLSFGDDEEVEEEEDRSVKAKGSHETSDKKMYDGHKKDKKKKDDKTKERDDIEERRLKMLQRLKTITVTKEDEEDSKHREETDKENDVRSERRLEGSGKKRRTSDDSPRHSKKRRPSEDDGPRHSKKRRPSEDDGPRHSEKRRPSEDDPKPAKTRKSSEDKHAKEPATDSLKDAGAAGQDGPLLTEEERLKAKESAERKAEIRRLKRELRGKTAEAEKQEEREEESKKEEEKEGEESALDAYAREKQKYVEQHKKNQKKSSRERAKATMALFDKFKKGLTKVIEGEAKEEDDWMVGPLVFGEDEPVLAKDANTKDGSWYDLDDPRHPTNMARREKTKDGKGRRKDKTK